MIEVQPMVGSLYRILIYYYQLWPSNVMISSFPWMLLMMPVRAFYTSLISHHDTFQNKLPMSSVTFSINPSLHSSVVIRRGMLQGYARSKSKWDDLIDEDDQEYHENSGGEVPRISSDVPTDMLYKEANIIRQANTFDQLVETGGTDVINDVYVRAPNAKEWWLVGKVARISDVTPEQAIERQWPLIERHVWALRLPVRPISDLSASFEVWYAPGDTEYKAAVNDPSVNFTKISGLLYYGGVNLKSSLVGFVGKAYDIRKGEPLFFVERNIKNGAALKDREIDGEWLERSASEENT